VAGSTLLSELANLGWRSSSSERKDVTNLVKAYELDGKNGNATVSVLSGSVTTWSAADPISRTIFEKDLKLVLSKEPKSVNNRGLGSRATGCPTSCPIWTCSYREKVTWNSACAALGSANPGFGYTVRYRTGRCFTGGYGCNSCAWWADYQGNVADCPACETSASFTILDCNWP